MTKEQKQQDENEGTMGPSRLTEGTIDSNLEKRLHNVECMLMALCSAVKEVLPPEYQRMVGARQSEWYEASQNLGAFDIPALKGQTH